MIFTIIIKEGKGRNIYILITCRKASREGENPKGGKDLRFSPIRNKQLDKYVYLNP